MNIEDIYEIISPYQTHDDFYVLDSIPEKKLKNAWNAYPLLQDDQIIALIDSTVFGSAKNGMLIGLKGISFKNDLENGAYLSWKELANRANIKKIFFGIALTDDHEFNLSGSNMKAETLIVILLGILNMSREEIVVSHTKHADIHSNTDEEAVFNDIRIIKYIEEDDETYFLVSIDDALYISGPNIFFECPEDIEVLCDMIDDESEIEMIMKLLKSEDVDDSTIITKMSCLFNWGNDYDEYDDNGNIIPHPILSKIVGVRLDTSNVTNMFGMFWGLTSLKYVEINTANVVNMIHMFCHCSSLEKTPKLDTSNALYMDSMFDGCTSLKHVDIDTANVTHMDNMFQDCTSLKHVELSTSKAKAMICMFKNCVSLEKISHLDTSNAIQMWDLFKNCNHLTQVNAKFNLEALVESVLEHDDGQRKKEIKDKIAEAKKDEVNAVILMCCLGFERVFEGCSCVEHHPVLFFHLSDDMWLTLVVDSSPPAPVSALDDLLS